MKTFYEGQSINLENEFEELIGNSHSNYDFVELKGETHSFLFRTPFYQIPCTYKIDDKGSYFLAIRFYEVEKSERSGILKFTDLDNFDCDAFKRVATVIFNIETPCYHQEFYKGDAKYLAIKPKTTGKFKVFAARGEIINEGPFHRVLGDGPYVFKTSDVMYHFIN